MIFDINKELAGHVVLKLDQARVLDQEMTRLGILAIEIEYTDYVPAGVLSGLLEEYAKALDELYDDDKEVSLDDAGLVEVKVHYPDGENVAYGLVSDHTVVASTPRQLELGVVSLALNVFYFMDINRVLFTKGG